MAIAGGEDTIVSRAEMKVFRAAPGGCEFHLLPHAGHFAAYEQPRKVAALHLISRRPILQVQFQ
jgi:pimeloyl-ACP methyl ester carboxylesterase